MTALLVLSPACRAAASCTPLSCVHACTLCAPVAVASFNESTDWHSERALQATLAVAICREGGLTGRHSQVYRGQPGSVLAVEPSREMSRLGQRIQEARLQTQSEAGGASPSLESSGAIRWASSLPGMRSSRPRRSQAPRYTPVAVMLRKFPHTLQGSSRLADIAAATVS